MHAVLVVGFLLLLPLSDADAGPLRLDYEVTDLGTGLFEYEFDLVLDNSDGSWAAGQGWAWFIFGDAQSSSSPLTNWAGDAGDLPVGPWTSYSSSGGFHNGPTFASVSAYWVPTGVLDSLSWSGTSTADLAQGQLLFSTLLTQGGAVAANFDVARRIPEPTTLALFGLGLVGVVAWRRKKHKPAAA
jgi:hypothetical protein